VNACSSEWVNWGEKSDNNAGRSGNRKFYLEGKFIGKAFPTKKKKKYGILRGRKLIHED